MEARTPAVTRDFRRTTLSASSAPMVRALAEAMFSQDGEVTRERLDAFVDEVDAFISPASKTLRAGLLVMLGLLRWSPLLFGRLRPFDALDVDARVAHLERLDRSRVPKLPLLFVAYKTILTMLFYEDPRELARIGYPGAARRRYLALGAKA